MGGMDFPVDFFRLLGWMRDVNLMANQGMCIGIGRRGFGSPAHDEALSAVGSDMYAAIMEVLDPPPEEP